MCGIAGLVDIAGGRAADELGRLAAAMGAVQAHRGPDSSGLWTSPRAAVAFAHQRLAIQDLSAAGHQPMLSPCGRFALTYNGEIYNGAELRGRLEAEGCRFRGLSDTEVLLAAIARWGIEAALEQSIGMFAFALWDEQRRELSLVCDRIGIKPLYWCLADWTLFFASELKGIVAGLGRPPAVSREGLAGYLGAGYIGAPLTIYEGVSKVPPGHILRLSAEGTATLSRFWSLDDVVARASSGPRITDPAEAAALIRGRVAEAVRDRLISDVPLGAFLSGGIDSSLVALLMQEANGAPINTYTIGSPDQDYDEARQAREIAALLGTRHTELEVGEADCLAAIPGLAGVYDEPFGDSSAVPTLVLSRLAKQHVTVVLSGDGGDELFAGYNRYRWYARLAGLRRRAPGWLLAAAAGAVMAAPAALVDRAAWLATREGGAARRIHKLAEMLRAEGPEDAYWRVTCQWPELSPARPAPGGQRLGFLSDAERMQLIDLASYLPGDILTKVDRASMAHALEVRVPYLDHRVVEAAFRLAPELKLRGGTTKWVLRELLAERLPRALFDRPKQGFAIPIERWLRAELRDWAQGLIEGTDWEGRFGLTPAPIRAAWAAHLRGASGQADRLWSVLMLGAWAEIGQGSQAVPAAA